MPLISKKRKFIQDEFNKTYISSLNYFLWVFINENFDDNRLMNNITSATLG
jgi:hypothetical protein